MGPPAGSSQRPKGVAPQRAAFGWGAIVLGMVAAVGQGQLANAAHQAFAGAPSTFASAPSTFAPRPGEVPPSHPSPSADGKQGPSLPAGPLGSKAPPGAVGDAGSPANSKARSALREGAWLVDQVGYFRTVGDRWVFVIEPGGPSLVALENRNLERIARAVASYPRRLRWKVTASVTEFLGNHFILVETAVVKSEEREPAEGEPPHPARGGQRGKNASRGIASRPEGG